MSTFLCKTQNNKRHLPGAVWNTEYQTQERVGLLFHSHRPAPPLAWR